MAEQDKTPPESSGLSDPALARLGEGLNTVRERKAVEAASRRPDADPRAMRAVGKAWSLAIEMVAAVGVSVFIGWWLDRWLGTAPWCLLVFILLGIATAMWSAIRTAMIIQRSQLAEADGDAKKTEGEVTVATSPLDQFKVKCIAFCGEGGQLQAFSFTNASAFMVLAVICATILMVYGVRQRSLVPGRLQSVAELTYEFVANMVRENVGPNGRQYFPFIFTLFIFVLFTNMLGMMPYSFTVTSHIIVTFALAMLVFLGITLIAIARNGIHFFTHFMPAGVPMWLAPIIVPIEIISYLSRPISLSLRLCANMLAGHTTLKVFAGFIISMIGMGGVLSASGILPLIMVTALTALEFLIAFLQAYVFAILTCLYLAEAVNMEHH